MRSDLVGPVEIKSLAFGGSGVARHDGRVIFVHGGVPGDRVRVRILKEKKRYAEAEAVRFDKFSTIRCMPDCPVFGDCGGCQWQMLPYSEQLRQKEQIFADILRRHYGDIEGQVLPILESPNEWHYRSRVQFKCHALSDGQMAIGFFRSGSHYVVDVTACPLADHAFNTLLPGLRRLLDCSPFAALIPQIDMEKGDGDLVRLVVHYLGDDDDGLQSLLGRLKTSHPLSVYLQKGRKSGLCHLSGPGDLEIEVDAPALRLTYAAGGFAQVNLAQNRRMVAEALRMASLDYTMRVLDLYCGMGNFSLPLARRAREVTGVEDFSGSVEQGKRNARRNKLDNVQFVARPAQGACADLSIGGEFDLVVLDPPRAGAKEALEDLLKQRVKRLLYVSCDPMTLVRDLKFLKQGGYRLIESRPVDMFPQTYHLESLSLMEWGS